MVIEEEKLLKVYELTVEEQHRNIEIFEKKIEFLWKILSIFITVSVVGIFKATEWEHYLILVVPAIMAIFASYMLDNILTRSYRPFLETIAKRIKVENKLGLFKKIDDGSKWENESFVTSRHINNLEYYKTSEEFVEAGLKTGVHRTYKQLSLLIRISSLSILVLLFTLVIINFK